MAPSKSPARHRTSGRRSSSSGAWDADWAAAPTGAPGTETALWHYPCHGVRRITRCDEPPVHQNRRLPQNPVLGGRPKIQQRQHVRTRQSHDPRDRRELRPPRRVIDQRIVRAGRHKAVRRRRPRRGPGVHRIQHRAEKHGCRDIVGIMPPDPPLWRPQQRIGGVLRTGPAVNPYRVRLRQIVSLRVRMRQRPAPHPILRRRLRMEHQRIGLRTFQNRVPFARQMIRGPGIGKRKLIRDVEMILILLPARHNRIGKPVVHPFPSRPRHMRHRAIEHPPSLGVRVIPAINKIP